MSFRTGDVIGGRYELGGQLGAGGMARVYLAHDRLLDREVAVKVLSEHYAADPQFVERFRREASAAAGLNHPNIVAVYDRGEANGSYYIVMEYLSGPDLKQVIRDRAPLPPIEAIDYALQFLAALGAAHKRDVVHRDVKPQNAMVGSDGHLKVTDFGIARAGAQSGMTEAGSVIGTAQYLSPEQARGDEVTAASDCYAVGIVLYEMLTGRVPFDAERPVAVAMKQISDPPTPPTDIVPSIPHTLEGVVLHSLAKRPSERYRTAEEFRRALLDVRAELDGTTAATRVIPAAADAGATEVMPQATAATRVQPGRGVPPPSPEPPPSRRRWPWILGAVLIALLLAAGAFALMSGDGVDTVTIPDVAGQPAAEAERTLEELGLVVVTRNEVDDTVQQGRVIRTDPPAGTAAEEGSTVTMLVSGGPGLQTVPDVVGLDSTAAHAAVVRAGFEVDVVEQPNDTVPENRVISQEPGAGAQAERGSLVTLTISTGPEDVDVPNLTGLTEDAARAELERAGLQLGGVSTAESDAVAPGRVISQNPGRGTTVARGASVSIVLAIEPEPDTISVPSVIGNFAADAQAKLSNLGFLVTSDTASSGQPAGVVISQTPSAGTEVERGSRVVITVSTGPETTETPTETVTTIAPPPTVPPGGAQVPAPELP
jgi:eukaryotic-like serine/threonine-protein kinase